MNTNKIDLIKAEVERLKSNLIHGACSSQVTMETRCKEEAYNKVLAILDTMQEEPVSEGRDIFDNCLKSEEKFILPQEISGNINCENCLYSSACALGDIQACIIDKPVSEDLGDYINELSKQFPEVSFAKLSRIAVMVSKWQKEQDQSTIELAEDHAMFAGMEKMKEQMMANTIDGVVTFDYYGDDDKTYGCIAHDSFCLEDRGLKDMEKVKLVIIKDKEV